ncbi:MAG: hypothetical protein ACYC3I_06180 [Gemmataceae bacterium]
MKRHTAEQILPKLRQVEVDLAQGLTIPRAGLPCAPSRHRR